MNTPVERFWRKVRVREPESCWIWTGLIWKNNGYGRISLRGKSVSVHRFSYILHNGAIPEGLDVCHTCDNKLCVNPAHLWLGTDADNMADRDAKGRTARGLRSGMYTKPETRRVGEKNGRAKLTEDNIREIRTHWQGGGYLMRELADEYGVSDSAIWFIIHGDTWRNVH